MRCFIAVDIPEKIKDDVIKIQQELQNLDTRLVERDNMHFTLKFLGEIPDDSVKAVKEGLRTVKSQPIMIGLAGIGFFPSLSFIRVVWIGADSREFFNLHVAVNDTLADIFKKEKPAPHLTLARVRSQTYQKELLDFGKKYEKSTFGSFEVRQIKLKKSTLSKKGPAYEDVEVFELC